MRFDGPGDKLSIPNPVTDAVSVAFWYRAETTASGEPFTIGTGRAGRQLEIDPLNGDIVWTNGGTPISFKATDTALADGEWHLVTATRASAAELLWIYVDGTAVAVGVDQDVDAAAAATIDVVGGAAVVDIDQLSVFVSALDADRAKALFESTDKAWCMVAASLSGSGGSNVGYPYSRQFFDEVDIRGGRLRVAGDLLVRVDADAPVSEVSLPTEAVAPQPLLIGGTATDGDGDSVSGVDYVEVRVDNGQWVRADGKEVWSFLLEVGDGIHTVETRAVDVAGNTETAGPPQSITVDGVAPEVTLDAPPVVPVRPTTDPLTDQSLLELSGGVTDSGSGVASVEVLVLASGSELRDDGWQAATVNGSLWSLDYMFASSAGAVTGEFDVYLRAVDVVGNESSGVSPRASVTFDSTAPEVTLDDVDDVIVGSTTLAGSVSDPGGSGVAAVQVSLTPVEGVANSGQAAPVWQSAVVTGSLERWSFAVPDGLENMFQIDVRVVDAVGNERVVPAMWKGVIDTAAPRVEVTVAPTGKSDARRNRFQFAYRCTAEDRFLDESTFACARSPLRGPIRTFENDPAVQALFPDLVSCGGARGRVPALAAFDLGEGVVAGV